MADLANNPGGKFLNDADLAIGRIEYAVKDEVREDAVRSGLCGSGLSAPEPHWLEFCLLRNADIN